MKKNERYIESLNSLLSNAMVHAAERYSEKNIQESFDAVRRDMERLHGRINKLNTRFGIFDDHVNPGVVEEVVVPFKKQKRKRKGTA